MDELDIQCLCGVRLVQDFCKNKTFIKNLNVLLFFLITFLSFVIIKNKIIYNPLSQHRIKNFFSLSIPESIATNTIYSEKKRIFSKNHIIEERIYLILKKYNKSLDDRKRLELARILSFESKKYGYDPLFILALINVESSFHHLSQSNKGALGLMQIMPAVGEDVAGRLNIPWDGSKTLYNPINNVRIGIYILKYLEKRFKNDEIAFLTAYCHGPQKLQNILLNGETVPQNYAKKVLREYKYLKKAYTSEI